MSQANLDTRNQRFLRIENVGMSFPTKKGTFIALRDINLEVARGEFIALIGHSGCGKSTLLNLVAGLTTPTSGVLLLDDRELKGPGPERAVVFQNHSLLPWLTCFDNVALAVDQVFRRTMSKAERKEWIEHNLERVQMGHALHKRPGEISGGMKQRVGIARALAMKPKVLLLDEPTTWLDISHQIDLLELLSELNQEKGYTLAAVLHDLNQACRYASHLIAMRDGRIAAQGKPEAIFTEQLVEEVFGLSSVIIPDPVTGTPLVVPRGRKAMHAMQG